MNKVILLDCSGLFVPTVKVINRMREQRAKTGSPSFILPARVMYFNSILSCLKKIGITKDDIVIMALEGKSFRKEICAEYKDHRQGLRDADKFTDWTYEFQQVNDLHEQLDKSTNWHFIRVADGLEADDVIAVSTRFFKDKECIIITGDKDLHQLAFYENVKIFSATQKCKGSKGMFVKVDDPLKIIAEKARLGDKADNIIVRPDDTIEDKELRLQLVDLLNLPNHIEEKGIGALKTALANKKELNLKLLPNFKNIEEKFLNIYESNNIISPDYCYNLYEKRLNKKKEKLKERARAKKLTKAI